MYFCEAPSSANCSNGMKLNMWHETSTGSPFWARTDRICWNNEIEIEGIRWQKYFFGKDGSKPELIHFILAFELFRF